METFQYPSKSFSLKAISAMSQGNNIEVVVTSDKKQNLLLPELPEMIETKGKNSGWRSTLRWWRLLGFVQVHSFAMASGYSCDYTNDDRLLITYKKENTL